MAKLLAFPVASEHDGTVTGWPGRHKNVVKWWILEDGRGVGWNENMAVGWSFPVISAASVRRAQQALEYEKDHKEVKQ